MPGDVGEMSTAAASSSSLSEASLHMAFDVLEPASDAWWLRLLMELGLRGPVKNMRTTSNVYSVYS